tara:strand:- start:513 stop:689 length:177 start_codon:yes stop_codon:yes gene_type:complete
LKKNGLDVNALITNILILSCYDTFFLFFLDIFAGTFLVADLYILAIKKVPKKFQKYLI